MFCLMQEKCSPAPNALLALWKSGPSVLNMAGDTAVLRRSLQFSKPSVPVPKPAPAVLPVMKSVLDHG